MPHRAEILFVRRSVVISLAAQAIAFAVACSGEPTGPGADRPQGPQAIHILLHGRPVEPLLEVGALGAISFSVAEEDAEGRLTPVVGRRVVWGSTYPAVADAYEGVDYGYALVKRNGRARIIAEVDGLRDTVSLAIAQVAVAARVLADTVVVLTADAVDLGGGGVHHDPLYFPAIRVDSNGYEVSSSEEIRFSTADDAPFTVAVDGLGDRASITGTRPGTGTLIVSLGGRSDTVLVQVTNAFRVVHLVETPSGVLRVVPDTARITRGAAVIFQNDASFTTSIGGENVTLRQWRAGPIPVSGREAQLFTEPDTYRYGWGGSPRAIVVTP